MSEVSGLVQVFLSRVFKIGDRKRSLKGSVKVATSDLIEGQRIVESGIRYRVWPVGHRDCRWDTSYEGIKGPLSEGLARDMYNEVDNAYGRLRELQQGLRDKGGAPFEGTDLEFFERISPLLSDAANSLEKQFG
jgi:hypothetical protein